jgi:hypothetical protein
MTDSGLFVVPPWIEEGWAPAAPKMQILYALTAYEFLALKPKDL